jgi:hypothetical protein
MVEFTIALLFIIGMLSFHNLALRKKLDYYEDKCAFYEKEFHKAKSEKGSLAK